MLVVTIIIAAVVSAFAGGMTTSKDQNPQIKISAEFSQSKGMKIYHEGGDELEWQDIRMYIRPNMGRLDGQGMMDAMSYEVIKSNMTGVKVTYLDGSKIYIFKPGDVAYLPPKYLDVAQTRPDGTVDYYHPTYGMGSSTSRLLGTNVDLELVDNKRGVTVATTKMKILS